MRITSKAVALTSMQGLYSNLSKTNDLQRQLTTGKQFSRPSESPTGTNTSMQMRAETRAVKQHERNIADADGWLNQTDSVLQNMMAVTRRARDLTLQAKSDGNSSVVSRDAIAKELDTLRESLLGMANTNVRGRPLFGGVTGGEAAYDTNGAWVGNGALPVERRVSTTETVRIDITGIEAFGDPATGDDLFSVIANIAAEAPGNPGGLAPHLDQLDVIMDKMMTALADVGARQARVDNASAINTDRSVNLRIGLSEVEAVDLPEVIMNLEMQKVAYEAALKATAQALQPTLMDFLR